MGANSSHRMDSPVSAVLFDAYGTLFDVHSAVRQHGSELGPKADTISLLWRAKQIEYTWLRSMMGRHADFWTLTQDALDYALEAHGAHIDPALRQRLLSAYETLEPYPDARPLLETLRERGLPAAILSNGTPAMLAAAVRGAGFESLLDGVYSVESVGIFKPDARVYELGRALAPGVPASSIGFVSSNGWDAAGAAAFGFRVAWVNRAGLPAERLPVAPAKTVGSLQQLAAMEW